MEKSPEFTWPKSQATEVRSHTLLYVLLCTLSLVALLAAYVWYGMSHTPYTDEVESEQSQLDAIITNTDLLLPSEEEKIKRLESLQQDVQGLDKETKYKRLEALSQ